jgi:hypothetical protein
MAAPFPRFTVRKGTRHMMVWDRDAKGPAKIEGSLAIGLTIEQAIKIAEKLTKFTAPESGSEGEGK